MNCNSTHAPEDVWLALGLPVDESQREYLDRLLVQSEEKLSLILESRGANVDRILANPRKSSFFHALIVEAVVRMERNEAVKNGYVSESEGNYSYSVGSARDVAGHLWWPEDDLALLAPRRGRTIGTIRTPRMRRV